MSFLNPTSLKDIITVKNKLDKEILDIKEAIDFEKPDQDTLTLKERVRILEIVQDSITQQVSNIHQAFYHGGTDG